MGQLLLYLFLVLQNGRGCAKTFGAFDITGGRRIFMYRHQNAGQNRNINIANEMLQNVARFKIGVEKKDMVLFHG